MVNPLKGEVEWQFGERRLVLRFSIDAICSLEERLGKGFPAIAAEMSNPENFSIRNVRNLLFAALTEHQPDITLKEAGELILEVGDIAIAMAKVNEALGAAFPTAEASGTKNPPKRRGPIG